MNLPSEPRQAYQSRLERYQNRLAALENQLDRIGTARLAAAIIGLILIGVVLGLQIISVWWLFATPIPLIGLSIAKSRLLARRDHLRRAAAFHERGLARIDDRWMGAGETGVGFSDEQHLYAADLDLFGNGSLYQRLCEAHTRGGQEALAAWLKQPAEPDLIRRRQSAVADLRNRLDLRERLALLGESIPGGIDTRSLSEWASRSSELPIPTGRIILNALTILLALSALIAALYPPGLWLVGVVLAVQTVFVLWLNRPVRQVLADVERRAGELLRLAGILALIESEQFESPRLQELQQSLKTDGKPPSRQLADLVWLIDLLNSRRNQLFIPIALLLAWGTRMAFAIEAWRSRCGSAVGRWFEVIAEMEALLSLAGYAFENSEDPFPQIAESGSLYHGVELRHPLLSQNQCVPNDLQLGPDLRLLIVSGSNMSGKSTFLRTVGINAVLAFAGAPVRAKSLRLSPFAIGATLRIQDSLMAGKSRFYSEITRIEQIVEKAKGPLPLLFLLDELLHGTNSHDRGIGGQAIVLALVERGAIGLITTHDLTLAHIADTLGNRAANVHFADVLVDGKMVFDYKMQPGVVRHSNAIALMRAVGLPV
jgi:hypothetical protein